MTYTSLLPGGKTLPAPVPSMFVSRPARSILDHGMLTIGRKIIVFTALAHSTTACTRTRKQPGFCIIVTSYFLHTHTHTHTHVYTRTHTYSHVNIYAHKYVHTHTHTHTHHSSTTPLATRPRGPSESDRKAKTNSTKASKPPRDGVASATLRWPAAAPRKSVS